MTGTIDTPYGKKGFGYLPDLPDFRDHTFSITKPELLTRLPVKVDLRQDAAMSFPLFDQGDLGSCTANAIGAAIVFAKLKQSIATIGPDTPPTPIVTPTANIPYIPSRLFIYYNERDMEGTVNSDAGAMIRDGIKSVNSLGACRETTWPYDIAQFKTKPLDTAYTEGQNYQAIKYRRLYNSDINQLKGCLAQGFPFVFGFTVYNSFYRISTTNPIMPMPSLNEKVIGGHAVLAVGYDDTHRVFIIRNSWGDKWADKGYFYMPYKYITNNNVADDFWTITLMEQEQELLK